jgi:hypothetical protein
MISGIHLRLSLPELRELRARVDKAIFDVESELAG